ncbi:hypothetical protein ABZ924_31990 [Streptomyces sp. NPDC046876]|uniref:hypothetical protein n=1 Tax=Streptomyces sp. NPDC046876 TaxID=3155616 RepID=UPI0033EA26E4
MNSTARRSPARTRFRTLLRAWLSACTVPAAHASSPLAHPADAALTAARVGDRAA